MSCRVLTRVVVVVVAVTAAPEYVRAMLNRQM